MPSRVKDFNRLTTKLVFLIVIASFFVSCKTGSSVSDNGILQKRKYQKGFYVNVKSPFDKKQKLEEMQREDAVVEAKSPQFTQAEYALPPIQNPTAENEVGDKTEKIDEKPINYTPVEANDYSELEANAGNEMQPDVFAGNYSFHSQHHYENEAAVSPQNVERYNLQRMNTLAILSFIFGVLSLFILGIPLGISAVVCGIVGLIQINKNPELFRGAGFAVAGIAIGLISVVVMLLLISTGAL